MVHTVCEGIDGIRGSFIQLGDECKSEEWKEA